MYTDMTQLAIDYPHLAAAFAHLPQGEAHLQRLQDLNTSWQRMLTTTRQYAEVVVSEERPAVAATATFDIIYAGGGLNLLNAAIMTLRYGRRVLVFDRFTVGAVHREWNISREELQELIAVGLLTSEELETVVQRTYREGLVRFHSAHIHVPATELRLQDVLDIAVDAEKLMSICIKKILEHQPAGGLPNVILHGTTFERCAVQPGRGVVVDVYDSSGLHASYGARLLIDGMGSTSPIACQLNCGRPFSLVCPTVGTVARGYKQGNKPGEVDPEVGEVLVTTEDVRAGHQLIWEAFPGRDDQVAIYLFYYAEADQRVDLLRLFDDFFALLPSYKDTTNVEILKPVYGFIPAGYAVSVPWQRVEKVLAYDHVLSLGDSAAFQSPLTFCGFGSYVRNVRRITKVMQQALQNGCLKASDLSRIHAAEAVPAVARVFSKFMIAQPNQASWQINETLNVFCRVLQASGVPIAQAFFKDRVTWLDYTCIVLRTPRYYPNIFRLALTTLTFNEMMGWLFAWLQLGRQSAMYQLYRLLNPFVAGVSAVLRRPGPHLALRLLGWREAMEQVGRGIVGQKKRSGSRVPGIVPQSGPAFWLGGHWPQG